MFIKLIFLLYLISYSNIEPFIIKKSRKDRALLPITAVIVIAALILTPIIIGSVTAGYVIAYTLHKNGENFKFKYLFYVHIVEKLVRVNFPFTVRIDDQRFVVTLENFNTEYIFKKAGEIINNPDIRNVCFDG